MTQQARTEIIAALNEVQEDHDLRPTQLVEIAFDALKAMAPIAYAREFRERSGTLGENVDGKSEG